MKTSEFLKERIKHLKEIVTGDRFNDLCPLDVFELMLGFVMEEKRALMYAKRMYDTFGTLSAALEAPSEYVTEILGGDERATDFFNLIPMVGAFYRIEKINSKTCFDKVDGIAEFCINRCFGDMRESLTIVLLNKDMTMMGIYRMAEGNLCSIDASFDKIAEIVFKYGAARFVLVHNHPDEMHEPSERDMEVTARLVSVFMPFERNLVEHIITSGCAYIPMLQYMQQNGMDIYSQDI